MVDMPMDRLHPHLSRGCAYVEFETPEEAQKALKHMDGGRPEYFFQCLCLAGLFSFSTYLLDNFMCQCFY